MWGSWGSVTGNTTIGSNYNCHCVYSASVSMAGASSLNSVTFKDTFAADMSASLTLQCYLYSSDPTSGGATSPPSGYISSYQTVKNITAAGLTNTISFTGLNLSSASMLYVWVTASYNASGGAIYCCDMSGVDQPTTITGSFSAAVMSLSISPATVTTGNAVALSVANGSGYTLTATFKYGNTTLATQTFYYGSTSVTCPKSWFTTAGVTMLTSMTVSVTVTGGTSTMTDSFTLSAGNDMKPTVGTPTAAIVQASSASDFPSTYIAGVSKCKVSAAVSTGSNASISTVRLTYPGGAAVNMIYNSGTGKYEGTTAAPITVDTTFTVTATDVRGLSASSTVSVSGVVPYTAPSVVINTAYRCDSSGTEESGGAYWKIKVTATYSTNLTGNSLTKLTAGIEGGTANNLTSGTLSSPFSGMTNSKAAYKVIVTVKDKVSGEVTKEITLEGLSRNIVVLRSVDGTYVGVGTTPTNTSGKSTVEMPEGGRVLTGGIDYGAFEAVANEGSYNSSFGSDMLNVNRQNRYAEENAAAAFSTFTGNISNIPSTISSTSIFAGLRMVLLINQYQAFVLLFETSPTPGRVWINTYTNTAWQGWKYFYTISV